MALPAAASTWKYIPYLVRAAEVVIPGAAAYLESALTGGNEEAELTWMRWHVLASRISPAGTTEDQAQFKLDLLNITSGAVDSTWTAGDFTNCKTPIETMLTAFLPYMGNHTTYSEHRVYAMRFNPDDPGPSESSHTSGRPFMDTGPPVYSATGINKVGTGSAQPYQLAGSVTFRTAWPRHWGRIYLPSFVTSWDTTGRISSAARAAIPAAVKTCAGALADAGFLHVVPVQQLAKQPFHGLLGVTQYAMDDIPDVVRRRRARTVSGRTVV